MSAILLAAGAKGKRYSLPNSRIMIHQPSVEGLGGQASDIKIHAEEMLRVRNLLSRILAEVTGQSFERIDEDSERDFILSPLQACEYGLIDSIFSSRELPVGAESLLRGSEMARGRRVLLERFHSDSYRRPSGPLWQPAVDVYKTPDGWKIKFDLAGVKPNDVEVVLLDGRIVVRGVRRDSVISEGWSYYQLEITYSRFERVLQIPCDLS